MSYSQRTLKRKGRRKAVTVLGFAGALSLAGGASGATVGPPSDTLTANTAVTLYEEEISDVSLSTFYVFDHENAGRPGLRLNQPIVSIWGWRSGWSRTSCKSDIADLLRGHSPNAKASTISNRAGSIYCI